MTATWRQLERGLEGAVLGNARGPQPVAWAVMAEPIGFMDPFIVTRAAERVATQFSEQPEWTQLCPRWPLVCHSMGAVWAQQMQSQHSFEHPSLVFSKKIDIYRCPVVLFSFASRCMGMANCRTTIIDHRLVERELTDAVAATSGSLPTPLLPRACCGSVVADAVAATSGSASSDLSE